MARRNRDNRDWQEEMIPEDFDLLEESELSDELTEHEEDHPGEAAPHPDHEPTPASNMSGGAPKTVYAPCLRR